jgi:hypothetical protein
MKMLSRAILMSLAALMIAGTIAYASGGQSVSPPGGTAAGRVSALGATDPSDLKGRCDEAEHANDARCNGVHVSDDNERAEGRNDDRGGINEQEGADDSGNHSASTVTSDNGAEHASEMERGDDSGHSREMEAADDSSQHSDNSGPGSHDHGLSGRDHPEDD